MAEQLTDTRTAVINGTLDGFKAKLITEKTRVLTGLGARMVQAQILPKAPELSYAKLGSELDRLVAAADPRGANERHDKARTDRRCWTQPLDDGMGRFLRRPVRRRPTHRLGCPGRQGLGRQGSVH